MLREAMLYRSLEEGKVECFLCHHRCVIAPGKWGICGVRENQKGKLVTHVYGEVIAAHVDPIEKKPLYHFYPGSKAFSVATIGCNFRCPFCQNWEISQATRKGRPDRSGFPMPPEKIVKEALRHGCRSISYTYTEPTIFFEYAYETAVLAREKGLANNFVTNGFMTEQALTMIQPYLDGANVDLKAFKEETYRRVCKAKLEPVLGSIKLMKQLGIWVEVTTLVVPGLNDSEEELRAIAKFLAALDLEIPWHVSRFHPDYEYTSAPPTPLETLRRAAAIGKEEGLKFIYIGNVWGEGENTFCPNCHRPIIKRQGFWVEEIKMKQAHCAYCGQKIPGLFD